MIPVIAMSVPVSKVAGVSSSALYAAAFSGAVSGVVAVALVGAGVALTIRLARLAKKILDVDKGK